MEIRAGRLAFTQSSKWSYLEGQIYDTKIKDPFAFMEGGNCDLPDLGSTSLVMSSRKPLPHVPFNSASWLIVSKKVTSILVAEAGAQVQTFPITIFDKENKRISGYYAVKIVNEKAAADLQKSDFAIDPDDGNIQVFYNLVLSKRALSESSEIFRLKEHTSYIIVTNSLFEAIKSIERTAISKLEISI